MQVALRRGKPLLALQAVRRAISLAGESHPDVHRITLRLCQRFRPHAEGAQNGTATARPTDSLPAISPVSLHVSMLAHDEDVPAAKRCMQQPKNGAKDRTCQGGKYGCLQLPLHSQPWLTLILSAQIRNVCTKGCQRC